MKHRINVYHRSYPPIRRKPVVMVMLLLATLAVHGARHDDAERPEWIAQPKSSDYLYLYVVGHATDQALEDQARTAAFNNALLKIARQIPGLGEDAAALARIERAEIVPGCSYTEHSRSGYAAWVQVSYPTAERQRLLSMPPTRTQSAPPTTSPTSSVGPTLIGPEGGMAEHAQVGLTMKVSKGALAGEVLLTAQLRTEYPPVFEEALPEKLAQIIRFGPVLELGPSGTQFAKPIEIQWRLPDELTSLIRTHGAQVEVAYFNGSVWQPFPNARTNADGTVCFEAPHFSLAIAGLIIGGIGVGATALLNEGAQLLTHPEKWINADSRAIKDYAKQGNVQLPDREAVARGGKVSLGLGRRFEPYSYWIVPQLFFGTGEAMLNQKTACCQEATFFAASILRAGGNPRFQKFICVQGVATDPITGKREGHMWMEIEVDGKIWAVDTANVNDLCLMSREDAYKKYKLEPSHEFTDAPNSRNKYKGLAQTPVMVECPRCGIAAVKDSNTKLCLKCLPQVMNRYSSYCFSDGRSGGEDAPYFAELPESARRQIEQNAERDKANFNKNRKTERGAASSSAE